MHCHLVGDNTGQIYVIVSITKPQGGQPHTLELQVTGAKSPNGREFLKAYAEQIKPALPTAGLNDGTSTREAEGKAYVGHQTDQFYHGQNANANGHGNMAQNSGNVYYTSPAWGGVAEAKPRIEEVVEEDELLWIREEPQEQSNRRRSSGKKHKSHRRRD